MVLAWQRVVGTRQLTTENSIGLLVSSERREGPQQQPGSRLAVPRRCRLQVR
jgi:hypothetical protein